MRKIPGAQEGAFPLSLPNKEAIGASVLRAARSATKQKVDGLPGLINELG